VTLLPYQLDGIAFAVAAGRAVLADDMGLGKTIQGVGVAEMLAREMGIRKVLVVCPASVKSQWRNEIVDLSQYVGNSSVIIKFDAVNGHGNNLYVDNIAINNNNVGIDEVPDKNMMTVYPNPASDKILISNSGSLTQSTMRIEDAAGRLVKEAHISFHWKVHHSPCVF
jgi:N12 class adenine-specific DNA methylase